MPKYTCGNCREESKLAPNARFCPYCGSTSLNLVIKELVEPSQKESVGVYESPVPAETVDMSGMIVPEQAPKQLLEEAKPTRRPSKQ